MEAGAADKVHGRTVRTVLNAAGYHYCKSRKKGLLRAADLCTRLDFSKNIPKINLGQSFWNNYISIYLDANRFQYKTQPECTVKGSKEGYCSMTSL